MAVTINNPIRTPATTDNPSAILAPWEFDHDDDSPRSLLTLATGQLLRGLEFTVNAIFDIGTIVIGIDGDTDRVMTVLNLVGLPAGTIVTVPDLWLEATEDTEVFLTLTGNPTTGQLDGFGTIVNQFNKAK